MQRFLHPITKQDLGSYKDARRFYFMEAARHEAGHTVAAIAADTHDVSVTVRKQHGLINWIGSADCGTRRSTHYDEANIILAGPVAVCLLSLPVGTPAAVSDLLKRHIKPYGVLLFGADFADLEAMDITPDNWLPYVQRTVEFVREGDYFISRVQDKLAAQYHNGCTRAAVRVVRDSRNFLRVLSQGGTNA